MNLLISALLFPTYPTPPPGDVIFTLPVTSYSHLQQQDGRLAVVLFGGDVQRGQADLAARVVFQQDGHHLVVALL